VHHRRGIVAVVLSLSLGVAATGCSQQSLVIDGSTVVVALDHAVTSFNDHTSLGNTPTNSAVVAAMSSPFAYYDDESQLVVDDSVGTMQVVSESPFAVQYTLASGVTWSDGVPIDSADLLLAWAADSGALNTASFDPSRFVDPETGWFEPFPDDVVYFDGAQSSGLAHARTTPIVSDNGRSITLVYDSYFADWQLAFAPLIPAHTIGSAVLNVHPAEGEDPALAAKHAVTTAITTADTAALAALAQAWNSSYVVGAQTSVPIVSAGPYVVDAVVPGESVTLRANPLYSGHRRPHFETVVVRTITDPLEAIDAVRSGTVDVIAPTPNSDVRAALAAIEGVTVAAAPSASWEHLDLQFSQGRNPTFDNPKLREAFLATVPRQAIVDEIARPADPAAVVRTSFVDSAAEPTAVAQPDIERARALIAETGVVDPEVCILYDRANPRRVAEFLLIQSSATAAGFVVSDCSQRDWQGFLGVAGAYDAALFAWRDTSAALTAPASRLRSTSTISNYSRYSNPIVDSLLDDLDSPLQEGEAKTVLAAIDRQLTADSYGLPLYQYSAIVAHRSTIDGVRPAPFGGGIFWNLWEWAPKQPEGQ
jgi:peptide/nickel transport system substrate-binding protein